MKFLILTIGLILVGCDPEHVPGRAFSPAASPNRPNEEPLDNEDVLLFEWVRVEVFQKFGCATNQCHGSAQTAGINLSSYQATLASVGRFSGLRAIVPGDAEKSGLYIALNTGLMPFSGKIEQELIDGVKLWIDQGAPEN